MSFVDNKYYRWYLRIVDTAKNRVLTSYSERHHIVPKSMNGDDSPENIVRLTAKEHFLVHLLLTKCTTGVSLRSMQHALGMFAQCNRHQERKLTSRQYQIIRENISEARKGTYHTADAKKKMSEAAKKRVPWNKGLKGVIKHSEESNRKRSQTLKGREIPDDQKRKISQSKIGKPSGMLGKKHSPETIEKMRETYRKRQDTNEI